ncbi:unnamed protein product [Bartonella choladocola]|uniref:hypothetical protein n=1 Tax=Bartonella choladocola TaxID=2750995 RepID=UPI003998197C
MAKKPAKSETLTLRLDPKTRFMVEFISRLRGQTITTVFERSIQDTADQATFYDDDIHSDVNWQKFWDVEEGIRTLRIAMSKSLRPTYEEERLLQFTDKFWPFFYTDIKCKIFVRVYISVLWERIEEFVELDEKNRQNDYWTAGQAMEDVLKNAHVTPPRWKELLRVRNNSSDELDKDIPF